MIDFLKSTIGRKQIVALAGIGLALFVFVHMAGNMLILVSPKLYNLYGHALITNPLIYVAETGLVAIFLGHAVLALALTLRNWGSRKQRYARPPEIKSKPRLFSNTMWFQGLVILAFVVLHLLTFKFGTMYTIDYDGKTVRDLHRLVIEVFSQPIYVVGYIFTLILMFGHLAHGFSSVFQSLGLNGVRNTSGYARAINIAGYIYSIVVVGGFISQPLYVFFIYNN